MSFALLQNALLMPLELMLNGVLALDAASKQRLMKLEGNTLAVRATEPAVTVFVSVRGNALRLSSVHEGPETASLQGPARALLKLLLNAERVDSLHAHELELRGDTGFVQQLQTVLRDLDIDWEYQVSRVLGDIPTQALADGMRGAGATVRNTAARVRDNVSEYLIEESGLLPNPEELEAFYREVAELKLRADRLQARIEQLHKDS